MNAPGPTPVERADELLSRMTLAEKARQVSAVMPSVLLGDGQISRDAMEQHLALGIGHVSNPAMIAQSPESLAANINTIQRFLVEHTRLGIPAMMHGEALNGVVGPGFTAFPTAIGLAATWNPDAVQQMTDIIRRQLRSVGVLQAMSPVMDIARDARWGRVHETYGEDVYLTTAMSVAFTRGLQGDDLSRGVLATGKHFLGYALTEGGQNMAAAHLGERELYDVYATPFEAAIRLAGLGSVMNSYSEVDGVPVAASHRLLTTLLRTRMGFEGTVVSDYATVEWLHTRQHVADSPMQAGVIALSAGLDVELPNQYGFGENLEEAVASGLLAEEILDEAVRRVLVDKFRVGLFDSPYAPDGPITVAGAESDVLSRRLAEQSLTLLKNDGILPLTTLPSRVAIIGPNADQVLASFAAYSYPAQVDLMKNLGSGRVRMAGINSMQQPASPEVAEEIAARRAKFAAIDTEQVARTGLGATSLVDEIRRRLPQADVAVVRGVGFHPDDPEDVPAAVDAAREADVVILAIGGRAGWHGTDITEGEGTDIARIELPPAQVELVRAVAATGTPNIAVVYQGRPYALTEIDDLVGGLLVAYVPGPHGSRAIVSGLLGDTDFSGHLPYSLPRATGQMPLYYSQKHGSGYRRSAADGWPGYIDLDPTPLYPFGHGLSYTTFEYTDLQVDAAQVDTDGGHIVASVQVRNTGTRDGAEVVQLYVRDTATGVTRSALQLAGFHRVDLPAGRGAVVSFDVATSQLGYTGHDGRFVIEPGPVELAVGSSSADLRAAVTVDLVGDTVDLEGRRSYLSRSTERLLD